MKKRGIYIYIYSIETGKPSVQAAPVAEILTRVNVHLAKEEERGRKGEKILRHLWLSLRTR